MRAFLGFVVVALVGAGCGNGRTTCHFNSDCAAGNMCVSGRCAPTAPDAGADAGGGVDAGRDAAVVMVDSGGGIDAGHDAAVVMVDGGSDAGHDAGSDGGRDGGRDSGRDAFVTPTGSPLWFSEYIEGSGNNKALEIVNTSGTAFDVTACEIRLYANGVSTMTASYSMLGSIPAHGVYTLCSTMATAYTPASCTDAIAAGVMGYNGNDAIELVCGGVTIDVIGEIGVDPGSAGWGSTIFTSNQTLRRMCSVTAGDPNGADPFTPETEWTGFPSDTVDGLGAYGCP